MKPKTWIYLNEQQEIKPSGATNDSFRISTGIRRPRHVFIWAVPTLSYNNQEANIFTFGILNIGGNRTYSRAQLEINNSTYYPKLEMTTVEESRLYRTLMSYSSAYNDFLSGSHIDRTNFRNRLGLLYFDLRNQEDDVMNMKKKLNYIHPLENYLLKPNKMITYYEYHVNLSDGQKANLAKAIKTSSEITLRLKNNQLRGNDELMLTKTDQQNRKSCRAWNWC